MKNIVINLIARIERELLNSRGISTSLYKLAKTVTNGCTWRGEGIEGCSFWNGELR